jgi:RNA polymerase sigma factor (sigma-70 family)
VSEQDDAAIQKLTAAMAAGHEDAVETFYRRYFDWLYAQARRATRRDESFCLDVVQDSVLRIVRNVRAVKSESQLRAWLRLVVQTTAFDQLRSERRRRKREQTVMLATVRVAADPPLAEQRCEPAQVDWLKHQIKRFDPQLVQLIEMRYQRNWTLARIAEQLGLSIGTVDGRLRRALKQLRERATEDASDE